MNKDGVFLESFVSKIKKINNKKISSNDALGSFLQKKEGTGILSYAHV